MPDTYEMTAHGIDPVGNYWVNTFHFELGGGAGLNPLQAGANLVAAFQAHALPDYRALLPTSVHILGYTARRVSAGGGPTFVLADDAVGDIDVNVQAAGICPDIAWQTAAAPWKWGHTFLPAVDNVSLAQGEYSAPYGALVSAFGTTMLGGLAGDGGTNWTFGRWTSKTSTFLAWASGLLRPKPTLMNRRLLPVT